MAPTSGMWIGIRAIPTYSAGGAPGAPIIHGCAVLSQQAKPLAALLFTVKPIASITQRPC